MKDSQVTPEGDIFPVLDGKYRLIKQPSYTYPSLDQVCIESIYTNHDDGTSDTSQAYFIVEERQADGSYSKLEARDFGYRVQRELQPAMEVLGSEAEGPSLCNTSYKFVSVHIPINEPRYRMADERHKPKS